MTFSALVTRDNRVLVSRDGRRIAAFAGADARRVIDQLERAEDEEAEQMALAKATGNYRRGNER